MGSKRAPKGSVKSVRSVREKTPRELNRAQKGSVKSVSSVREKTSQRGRKTYPLPRKLPNKSNLVAPLPP